MFTSMFVHTSYNVCLTNSIITYKLYLEVTIHLTPYLDVWKDRQRLLQHHIVWASWRSAPTLVPAPRNLQGKVVKEASGANIPWTAVCGSQSTKSTWVRPSKSREYWGVCRVSSREGGNMCLSLDALTSRRSSCNGKEKLFLTPCIRNQQAQIVSSETRNLTD